MPAGQKQALTIGQIIEERDDAIANYKKPLPIKSNI